MTAPRFVHKFRLKAPNAVCQPGGGSLYVVPGMVISYWEHYTDGSKSLVFGRVLDRPLCDGSGRKLGTIHLRVLQANETFRFGYLRYVDLTDVHDGSALPHAFAALFFHQDLTGELVEKMANYGSLCESYAAEDWKRRTGKNLIPPPHCTPGTVRREMHGASACDCDPEEIP